MKKFSLFIMLGFGVLCAQESKVKWGLLASPEIKYRFIFNSPVSGFRNGETAGLGYSLGFLGLKTLSEKKEFEFGLHYTNKGYRDYHIGRFGDQIDPTQGFIGDPAEININYNYNYLCIPLKLNLFTSQKSYFGFAIQSEVLLIPNLVTWVDTEKSSSKMENIKPFSASMAFGYGRIFQFNSFALRIEPSFNVNLINLYQKSVLSEHLFNFGLNTKWILN